MKQSVARELEAASADRRRDPVGAAHLRADLERLTVGVLDTVDRGVRPEKVRRRKPTDDERTATAKASGWVSTPRGMGRRSGRSDPTAKAAVAWESRVQHAVTAIGEVAASARTVAAFLEVDVVDVHGHPVPVPPAIEVRDVERRITETGPDGQPVTVTVLRPVVDTAPGPARRHALASYAYVRAVIATLEQVDPLRVQAMAQSQLGELRAALRSAAGRHGMAPPRPAPANRRCDDPLRRGCNKIANRTTDGRTGRTTCGACRTRVSRAKR